MDEDIHPLPWQLRGIVAQGIGNPRQWARTAAQREYLVTMGAETIGDARADVAGRSGDRDFHGESSGPARLAMRCAFAMTLKVMEVAGMLGKTEASTK